ncbi:phosphatidylglycerophosphatase A [Paucilactobacillus suebicus DSM 5007 = KCTC 3549]|uniref:Phosphatidylglycerophosphatase A n=2 Tax=Paucilactobacillus suebicus TaxID=152335 RepID=A0A0R1WCG2_9LACO|nr:phosphatidylglycerophosphatase A [Paucilactobacillus suebicus DSM 5007 = KCTC 3549]
MKLKRIEVINMMDKNVKYPDTAAYEYVISEFEKRGITIDEIAKVAFDLQKKHIPDIKMDEVTDAVIDVLHKREVLNNIMVGLQLDKMANKGQLDEPLQTIVGHDLGVFGVDETLGNQIATVYGQIGTTSYGYVDNIKPGIIGKLDKDKSTVNTFVDDLVGAVAAAVSGKVAHQNS